MKKSIFIIEDYIEEEKNLIQFFYIYPRFYYREGSLAHFKINKLLNKKYIGDYCKKLKFNKVYDFKYKNGLVIVVVYDKNETIEGLAPKKYVVSFEMAEDYNCCNCDYNKNLKCELWSFDIIDQNKYDCFFWEQRRI